MICRSTIDKAVKTTLIASLIVFVVCKTPLKSEAAPTPSTLDSVAAQYAQINDAIEKHDLDKIMSFFTDDFTEVNVSGGSVTREQERKDYESELGRIKSMQIHYIIQNCTTSANQTSCDVRFHLDGIGIKKIMFMKFEGAFTNDLIVHDVWIPTSDGLRLKSRQTVMNETKMASNSPS